MIEVVSIKFKNRGKCYFFAPNGLQIDSGSKVIVETSKGMEIADCCRGNHMAEDGAVVQPLRPVARIATPDDLRIAELNKRREKEAFEICQQKIAEHKLDMKLVDVECNFEGNKTMFFFTSDGRVDFRELVKDLAGIFRNRIELRQIGVRDEAKMIGGIGICGRPYCCNQFLEDFQPVSTKMAKVQSLSLNPTKISGSCGRLMCCLRYEQEAYEELIKKVPKQGAFVETKDGYGTAVQVNLLRQTVKVRLDSDNDDTLHVFKSNELASVPGGRPKDGETPPSVLVYVPEEPEEQEEPENDGWARPIALPLRAPETPTAGVSAPREEAAKGERRRGRQGRPAKPRAEDRPDAPAKQEQGKGERPTRGRRPQRRPEQPRGEGAAKPAAAQDRRQNNGGTKATVKPGKVEAKPQADGEAKAPREGGAHRNNRRRKPRPKTGGEPNAQ